MLGAVATTSLSIAKFVRGYRDVEEDLRSTSSELEQLRYALEKLNVNTAIDDGQILDESLRNEILSAVNNYSDILESINSTLEKYTGKAGAAKWAAVGKDEVDGLRKTIGAYRASLGIVLQFASISLSKSVKKDTAVVRAEVHDIRWDTARIMADLDLLRSMMVKEEDTQSFKSGQNYVLQLYLDSLTSYAETVCNDVEGGSDEGSLRTPSGRSSPVPFQEPSTKRAHVNEPPLLMATEKLGTVVLPDKQGQASSGTTSHITNRASYLS